MVAKPAFARAGGGTSGVKAGFMACASKVGTLVSGQTGYHLTDTQCALAFGAVLTAVGFAALQPLLASAPPPLSSFAEEDLFESPSAPSIATQLQDAYEKVM